MARYAELHRKRVVRMSTPAIDLLMQYHWPGNVRELENAISRAVLVCDDGVIRQHHLPPTLQSAESSGTSHTGSLKEIMDAFEHEILVDALKRARGNQTEAARDLQTTPRILSYRLRQHSLDPVRFR